MLNVSKSDGRCKMKVIGLTGGVGAGKSTVLSVLDRHDYIRVIEADKVGHLVMEPGTQGYDRVCGRFGTGILRADGTIDRGLLAGEVYADKTKLRDLNAIIHPAVKKYIRQEIEKAKSDGNIKIFVIEAALLIEDHYEEICDEFWYVYADIDARMKRLKDSRGYSGEKTKSVMDNQLPDEAFREKCARVIDNSGSPGDTAAQVETLLDKLLLEEAVAE